MSLCQRKAITKLQRAYCDIKVKVPVSSFMLLASSEIAKDWSVLSLEISCAQIFFSLRLGFMKPRMSYNFLYTWVWLWISEPPPSTSLVLGIQAWATMSDFMQSRNWILGFVNASRISNQYFLFISFLSRSCRIYLFVYVHVYIWMYLNMYIQSEVDRYFPQTLSILLFK